MCGFQADSVSGATMKQFDHADPSRNMFGLLPCPACGSRFRWPTQATHPQHPSAVLCDDCGRVEPIAEDRDEQERTSD
jgi:hypothetical protein